MLVLRGPIFLRSKPPISGYEPHKVRVSKGNASEQANRLHRKLTDSARISSDLHLAISGSAEHYESDRAAE